MATQDLGTIRQMLKKVEGPRAKASKGDAVARYCEPLATRDLGPIRQMLKKTEGPRAKASKGDAVARYCEPLATRDLGSHPANVEKD